MRRIEIENGAKIDCPKEYLNKTVYVVVREE